MSHTFFNPFEDLIFDEQFCFLSGDLTNDKITVFPEWLMNHFKFGEDKIEMMDKAKSYRYKDLILPCSPLVKKAFEDLDKKIKEAFLGGFEAFSKLDQKLIFEWAGKIVYGFLYYEMVQERTRLERVGETFDLSSLLRERFGNFHLMLQSVFRPIEFSVQKPWSVVVFPLKYSQDIFSFRDDAVNLLFSFGVNGFGFIACFQDNGYLLKKNEDIIEKMQGHTLHPLQYEELFARFHYFDYTMRYQPKYNFISQDNRLLVEIDDKIPPQFGFWDEDVFAQLLSNYWQVYGLEKKDILKFQKPILSFLENPYSGDFILPETIKYPF